MEVKALVGLTTVGKFLLASLAESKTHSPYKSQQKDRITITTRVV